MAVRRELVFYERLSRNRWELYKRMIRRSYIQQWNFFCTFTYDDQKHSEESFKKKLLNTLYHLSSRKGWRYIGAWERGELGQRLHFHTLVYIPPDGMVGELEEHNDYSTKRRRWEKSLQNSFFNGKFGRSDFLPVTNTREVSDSVKYMLKCISKNDERASSMRFIAKSYLMLKDIEQAKIWYMKSICEAPHLREPYCDMATALYITEEWEGVIYFIKSALKIKERPQTYINEESAWGGLPYDLLSIAYYKMGNLRLSLEYATKALEFYPNDERLKKNVKIIQSALDKKSENK